MDKTLFQRRAKIICTLGPSSDSYETIRALAESGMNVARLNFSHGEYDHHRRLFEHIRRVSGETGRPIAVLQDLQGPKIRVRTFEGGGTVLHEGGTYILTTRDVTGDSRIASVSYEAFNRDVRPGNFVLLDDGKIKLSVERIDGPDVYCRVIYGGELTENKGLNLPGTVLSVDALTEKDKADLRFGVELGVDYMALSFVQRPDDVRAVKAEIRAAGGDIPVVTKIEKPQAVSEIDAIIELADAVMIARGDLGVEMDTEEVPPVQKKIIAECNKQGVPVITATQMLESMINHARPTRAEAADVANAVLDGSDAVMLSGETAAGSFPVESVKTMNRIITLIERENSQGYMLRKRMSEKVFPTSVAIGYSACNAAHLVDASAIICFTQSGSTAQMIARFRPDEPIIAVTPRPETYYRTSLVWGVSAYLCEEFPDNMDEALVIVMDILKKHEDVKSGERIVATAGIPFVNKRGTNMLRVEEVP